MGNFIYKMVFGENVDPDVQQSPHSSPEPHPEPQTPPQCEPESIEDYESQYYVNWSNELYNEHYWYWFGGDVPGCRYCLRNDYYEEDDY